MSTYGSLVLLLAASAATAATEVSTTSAPQAGQNAATKTSNAAPAQLSSGEKSRRLLDEALLALKAARKRGPLDGDVVGRFRAAAEEGKDSVPALLDYAVALDRAGKLVDAEAAYRAATSGAGMEELRFAAAARAAALAIARGDEAAARATVQLAQTAMPD